VIAARLRDALGDLALRIEHIGSTSVPGLAAKDLVDVQVSVRSLSPKEPLVAAFAAAGYEVRYDGRDHIPRGWVGDPDVWLKLLFVPREGKQVNVHVRAAGSPNERYALLFRDYLRADPATAARWAGVKARVASSTATRDAYTETKDALTDELMLEAEAWALRTSWPAA
jgi:GrpB-like predicted nucleotidyltransferase (UPF0157 family)